VTIFVAVLVLHHIFGALRPWVNEGLGSFDIEGVHRRGNLVSLLYTFVISLLFSLNGLKELLKIRSLKQVEIKFSRLFVSLFIILFLHIDPIFWTTAIIWLLPNGFGRIINGPFVQVMHFAFWFSLFHAFKYRPDSKVENSETPPV